MTAYVNQNIRWFIGQHGISCDAKSATFATSAEALDTTALCTTGNREFIGGKRAGAFQMELMSDMAAGLLDEQAWALLGATNTPQAFSIGSAIGSPGYVMRSLATSYVPMTGQPGELAMASLSGSSSGAIARGALLATDTATFTTSGTTAAVNLGALSATQQLFVTLHVVSATGTTPTLAVIVQSDDASGFASPTNRLTFTTATPTTNRAQFGTVAGAVTDTWWRVSYTIGGTGPVFGFGVVAGITTL